MRKFFQKTSRIKAVLVVLILFTVTILSACNILQPAQPIAPTATPTQTPTATATIDWFPSSPTPTLALNPTSTLQPTPAVHREGIGQQLIDDDFSDASLWTTPQSPLGNVAFGTQNLTLAIARENTPLVSVSQHVLPGNFYLEITLQTTLCQPEDQFGLIFWRESEGDYYRLLMNCAGQYRLELAQGGQHIVVYDWDFATSIQPGAPANNRFGLYVRQGDFLLFVNDTFQFQKRVAQDRIGNLGLFARTVSGSAMTVRFSELQVFTVE